MTTGSAASRLRLLLGEVVVGRKRVGREVKTLGRHHHGRVGVLRVVYLFEERVLLRLFLGHLVPGLEERDQDVWWGVQNMDAVFFLHILERVGVLFLPLRP